MALPRHILVATVNSLGELGESPHLFSFARRILSDGL